MADSEERRAASFDAVEQRLRQILEPLRAEARGDARSTGRPRARDPGPRRQPWGYVAGIRRGKRYVSYYLMPAYADPELATSMSPELRRRMQGKSCFNFTHVDEPLFAELGRITRTTFEPHLVHAAEVAAARSPARSR